MLNIFFQKIGAHPERFFLTSGLLFGLILLILTPPFQVADEPAHFFRAYQISEGNFIGEKQKDGAGAYIPCDLVNLTLDLTETSHYQPTQKTTIVKVNVDKIKKYLGEKFTSRQTVFVDLRNTIMYSPLVYIPQSTGISIGRIFNLSGLYLMYLGRLFNLIFFLSILYAIIKIVPIFKWMFVIFGLMPMTLSLGASLSADVMTIISCFAFLACVLKLLPEDSPIISFKQMVLLFIISVFIGMSKFAYVFTPFLMLIVPQKRFGGIKLKLALSFFLFLISVISGLIWYVEVKHLYIPFVYDAAPAIQTHYVLTHPHSFIQVLWNTLSFTLIKSFVGILGWMDTPIPDSLFMAFLFLIIINFFLEDNQQLFLKLKDKLILFLILILSVLLLSSMIYITASEPYSYLIVGLQGRYFIPLIPILVLVFTGNNRFFSKIKTRYNQGLPYFTPLFLILTLLTTIYSVLSRYQYI